MVRGFQGPWCKVEMWTCLFILFCCSTLSHLQAFAHDYMCPIEKLEWKVAAHRFCSTLVILAKQASEPLLAVLPHLTPSPVFLEVVHCHAALNPPLLTFDLACG